METSNQNIFKNYNRDMLFLMASSVTIILSIVGNSLVITVIVRDKRLHSAINWLVVNMAVSDFLAGSLIALEFFTCSSYLLNNFPSFGKQICSFSQVILYSTYSVSSFTMMAIAIYRYLGIVRKPLRASLKPLKLSILSWIAAFLVNAPIHMNVSIPVFFTCTEIVTFRVVKQSQWNKLILQIRMVSMSFLQFILPLIMALFSYVKIAFVLRNRKIVGQNQETRIKIFKRTKGRITRMFVIILMCFTIVWLPIHFSNVYIAFATNIFAEETEIPTYFVFLYWFALSSCCFNPFIYFWYYKEFRSRLKNWASLSKTSLSELSIRSRRRTIELDKNGSHQDHEIRRQSYKSRGFDNEDYNPSPV
ncbi:putative G-protein coupled receptor 83-like protein [Dinothrombium tinctorium]|uniref:Putative G-protein coupled receptor 83-like protein n=1 Tax=Dinothrombium tinctorium TaxID=1965070 RepID=A0A443RCZ3_9ACAR|nr:putative G-protein coupled receptor 83-like protein [Dinothrombium tinctorium]